MKTDDQLKARAKELISQAVKCSSAAVKLDDHDQRRALMQKAYEASKHGQVVVGELIRRQGQPDTTKA